MISLIFRGFFFLQISIHTKDSTQKLPLAGKSLGSGTPSNGHLSGPWDPALIPAYIAAGSAIVVLLGTIIYDRWKIYNDEKIERREKLVYFAAIVKPIIAFSDKQGADIQKFAKAIEENPLEFPLMKYSPKNDLEKFVKRVEEEPLFRAFTRQYRPHTESVRAFKAITSAIEFQNLQLDQILEMTKTSLEYDYQRKVRFKASLDAALNAAADATVDQAMQEYEPFLSLLNAQMVKYLSDRSGVSDLKKANDLFVKPVIDGIVAGGYFVIPQARDIANHLHAAAAVYVEIGLQMNAVKDDFNAISKAYLESNKQLKESSQELLRDFFENQ